MRRLLSVLAIFFVFLVFPPSVSAQVVINEFQLKPSGSSQWIELYNKGNNDIDISNWIIDDNGGTEKFTISSGTVLPSKKCISFQSGNFHWNTSSDDSVKLIDASSNLNEEYAYTSAPADNITIGREVDGEAGLVVLSTNTKDRLNATNESCLAPTPPPTLTPQPATTAPTATPVATPTKTPIPIPTKSPTPKPTVKPTESPDGSPSDFESDVLGAREGLMSSESPSPLPTSKKLNFQNIFPVVFIIFGIILLGVGSYPFIKAQIKKYNQRNEEIS